MNKTIIIFIVIGALIAGFMFLRPQSDMVTTTMENGVEEEILGSIEPPSQELYSADSFDVEIGSEKWCKDSDHTILEWLAGKPFNSLLVQGDCDDFTDGKYVDNCLDATHLKEYYCGPVSGRCYQKIIPCNCSEGKCLPPKQVTCTLTCRKS